MLRFLLPLFVISLLVGADSAKKAEPVSDRNVERLRKAFPGDEIVNADCKLEFRSKGLLIAANEIAFDGGRMKLADCGIVQFEKDQEQGKDSRPTAIRSSTVFLTFDKPISAVADLGNRTIVSAELAGGVRLIFEK
jgi:hypothetical protein